MLSGACVGYAYISSVMDQDTLHTVVEYLAQMRNPTKEWTDKQQAAIMLASAKYCWKRKMERVPPDDEITWSDWFEKKYKVPLWKFREDYKKNHK